MRANNLSNKVIISCFLAGCLEMYDFAIFGFLTNIIHKHYLSFLDNSHSLIITYALFAVGFLFRPLGSLIFGYIGDTYGRKIALVVSVTLMGTASLGMCLLPSYQVIGVSTCYIIALIRIIQGISVGGEYNGAVLYAMEHTNAKNIGVIGSIVTAGSTLGIVIATFVGKIVQNPEMPDYSWRFAFLLGFGLSIVGYVIRKRLKESPLFNIRDYKQQGIPLLRSFSFLKTEFIAAFLVSAANNANFYFLIIFLPNYIKKALPFSTDNLGLVLTLLMLILVPIFGYLSDKIGRTKLIASSCLIIAMLNLFLLDLILSASSFFVVLIYACTSTTIISMMVSTINVFVIEIFPPQYRFSNAALSYSLGAAVFGGTVPMVAAVINERFGSAPK